MVGTPIAIEERSEREAVYKEIGGRIRLQRMKKGMTVRGLAVATRLTYTAMQNYEVGFLAVPYHRLKRIADALGVKAVELLPRDFV